MKDWSKRLTADEREQLRQWRRENRWHPNRLRHSFATIARRSVGLEKTRAALGHARAETTEIYAEMDLAAAAEVARRLG